MVDRAVTIGDVVLYYLKNYPFHIDEKSKAAFADLVKFFEKHGGDALGAVASAVASWLASGGQRAQELFASSIHDAREFLKGEKA